MNDAFVNAINTQKSTKTWMNAVSENLVNLYTPGYKESRFNFKTFLDSAVGETYGRHFSQGKSVPGTSPENVFLEGEGFFTLRGEDGKPVYTRLGEFKFDKEGVYKNNSGYTVQAYILNDKGEIMNGAKPMSIDSLNESAVNGNSINIPTTSIKMWIDPNNGKYLGKYEEFEFKGDGILYGKSDNGKTRVPLYKLVITNFHNPEGLFQLRKGEYVETEESGKPTIGRGEVRGGLIEQSNTDFSANVSYFQQAKMQLEMANKIISTNKQLLEGALGLLGS